MVEFVRPHIECLECGTRLGGMTGRDPFKHMLHCLHVEADGLSRLKDRYTARGGENAKRVLFLVDALLEEEHRAYAESR